MVWSVENVQVDEQLTEKPHIWIGVDVLKLLISFRSVFTCFHVDLEDLLVVPIPRSLPRRVWMPCWRCGPSVGFHSGFLGVFKACVSTFISCYPAASVYWVYLVLPLKPDK